MMIADLVGPTLWQFKVAVVVVGVVVNILIYRRLFIERRRLRELSAICETLGIGEANPRSEGVRAWQRCCCPECGDVLQGVSVAYMNASRTGWLWHSNPVCGRCGYCGPGKVTPVPRKTARERGKR